VISFYFWFYFVIVVVAAVAASGNGIFFCFPLKFHEGLLEILQRIYSNGLLFKPNTTDCILPSLPAAITFSGFQSGRVAALSSLFY